MELKIMENNGMVYTFTQEEIRCVGKLIKWAKEYKADEAKETITVVASAFNRPFFNEDFINKQ